MYLFLLILLVHSCSSGFGSKLAGKHLDVYYETKDLQPFADSLGNFWTKNKLIGDRKQSIKLTKNKGIIEIRLIQSVEFKDVEILPEEFALLHQLKHDLDSAVFPSKKTSLLICDDEFNTKFEVKY